MRKLIAAWRKLPPFYRERDAAFLPWVRTWMCINMRCNYPSGYSKKGIKNLINPLELRILWFRDRAYLMKEPSIHRKNAKKNYTLKNCEYMELSRNLSMFTITPKRKKESRERFIALRKTRKFQAAYRASMRRCWEEPEFRKIQSEIRKKNWKDPAYRVKTIQAQRKGRRRVKNV